MQQTKLYEKIYGCVLGSAIGDAFAIRTEMMHYRDIEAQYGRVTHFDPLPPRHASSEPPLERFYPFGVGWTVPESGFHPLGRWSDVAGVYTDDTRYRLLTCQTIIRKRGPINGYDLADEWLNYRLMAEGAVDYAPTLSWPGPERAYARMMASAANLGRVVHQQRPCVVGWDGPLGIVHAGDPARAATIGTVMSVAVSTALLPDATLDQVVANVLHHAGSLGHLAPEFVGRLTRLLAVAAECSDVFALRAPFYREFLVTFPPWEAAFALEMIPCALALCVIARGDAEQAIIGAANMGRDSDTIASMVGEVLGALNGVHVLPSAWVEQVVRLNPQPRLDEIAEQLTTIVVEQAEQHQRATTVLSQGSIVASSH